MGYKQVCEEFDIHNAYATDNVTNSLFEIMVKETSYTPPAIVLDSRSKIFDTIQGFGIFYKDYGNENRFGIEHMISMMEGNLHLWTDNIDAIHALAEILNQNSWIQKLSPKQVEERIKEINEIDKYTE